jgi:hypothetical protein
LNILSPSTHRLPKLHVLSLFPRVFWYEIATCVKGTFLLDLISSDVVTVLTVLGPSIYPPHTACILGPNIPLKLKGRLFLTPLFFVAGKCSSVIEATLLAEQQRQTSFSIATGIPKQL